MTFLALLLTGLYEREGHLEKIRCPLHPMQKLETRRNAYTQYAADMNVLLSYYNLLDDWIDEKKVGALAVARKLRPRFLEVCRKYPRQNRAVRSYMRKLMACEREKDPNMDRGSRLHRGTDGGDFCLQKGRMGEASAQNGIFYWKIYLPYGRAPGCGGGY